MESPTQEEYEEYQKTGRIRSIGYQAESIPVREWDGDRGKVGMAWQFLMVYYDCVTASQCCAKALLTGEQCGTPREDCWERNFSSAKSKRLTIVYGIAKRFVEENFKFPNTAVKRLPRIRLLMEDITK